MASRSANFWQLGIWFATLALMVGLLTARVVISDDAFVLDREIIRLAEVKYGKDASARLLAWEQLIQQNRGKTDSEKLKLVNHFFNSRIRFASDSEVWGVEDYWATPLEFLVKGAGDCEDFAIAKYFTLKSLGVAEAKLRITYVKALQYNVHHMVLTYYSTPHAEPLVLDNLVDSISLASKRTDLMPIFSFNGSGLWLAKQRGQGVPAGSSSRLRLWQDLLKKMAENKM